MSLRADITADLADILADADGLAESCSLLVPGVAVAIVFPAVISSPSLNQPSESRSVTSDGEQATARGSLAVILAAILAATGTARMPGLGDTITARGVVWGVTAARPTGGDGVLISMASSRAVALGTAWGSA